MTIVYTKKKSFYFLLPNNKILTQDIIDPPRKKS